MTSPTNYSMLDVALRYVEQRFAILPLHHPLEDGSCSCGNPSCRSVGKHPWTPNGVRDATCDPEQVRAWWGMHPNANIGLACGAPGLVVLDFDCYKPEFAGGELLTRLMADFPTMRVATGAGGVHLVYGQLADRPVGDSRGALPLGIDIKGRGYVVAPPSLHRSGKRYEWVDRDVPIAILPECVWDILQSSPHPSANGDLRSNGLATQVTAVGQADDIDKARKWLERLADWRREGYAEWLAVGMALSELSNVGLQMWDDWSRPSPKYEAGVCAAKWETFKVGDGLTLGSLKYWADEDDPSGREVPSIAALAVLDDAAASAGEDGEEDAEEPEANPLAVSRKPQVNLGWVDEYATLMSELTASPPEFNRLAGLVVVATVLQRRARLRMAFGDVYPNIYGVIIASSSVYHKSSALNKTRDILRRASLDKLLLSELMTSEGLLGQLQGRPAGLVLRDEIGTLFGSHNVKYLVNLKPDLTALYDCAPYSRRLAKDEIKVPEPYLNILGATTPYRFYDSVAFIDWQDGFLARWLPVVPEQEPDFDVIGGVYTCEHDARFGELAAKLVNLDRQRERDFLLEEGAFRLWAEWRRTAVENAYHFGDDVVAAIVARNATYALKFAIILAAVNGSWGTISESTMQTAIDLADGYKATFYTLLSQRENFGVSGSKLQHVFLAVKKRGGPDGASVRDICRKCHMRKGQVLPVLEKLADIGAVIVSGEGNKKRYVNAVDTLPARVWN
jgi:putative DNA primase/helicase